MSLFDAFLSDVVNAAQSRHGVHGLPDPMEFDEPELRLLAEDDYYAGLLGEPRRGPEWITYDPLRGVL